MSDGVMQSARRALNLGVSVLALGAVVPAMAQSTYDGLSNANQTRPDPIYYGACTGNGGSSGDGSDLRLTVSCPSPGASFEFSCERLVDGPPISVNSSECLGNQAVADAGWSAYEMASGDMARSACTMPSGGSDGAEVVSVSYEWWPSAPTSACGEPQGPISAECWRIEEMSDGNQRPTMVDDQTACENEDGPAPQYPQNPDAPNYNNCSDRRLTVGSWSPIDLSGTCGSVTQTRSVTCEVQSGGAWMSASLSGCNGEGPYGMTHGTQDASGNWIIYHPQCGPNRMPLADLMEACSPVTDSRGDVIYMPRTSRTVQGTAPNCSGSGNTGTRYRWMADPFPAPQGCGDVTQTRDVTCVDSESNNDPKADELCDPSTKPASSQTTPNVQTSCPAQCSAEPTSGNCATKGYDRLISSYWGTSPTPVTGSTGSCTQVIPGVNSGNYRQDTYVNGSCPGAPAAVNSPTEPGVGQSQRCYQEVEVYWAWEKDCRQIESTRMVCPAGTGYSRPTYGSESSPATCGYQPSPSRLDICKPCSN